MIYARVGRTHLAKIASKVNSAGIVWRREPNHLGWSVASIKVALPFALAIAIAIAIAVAVY